MVATLQDMPVTQLYLTESVANTGVGGTVTFYWNEGDNGVFKQNDNTEANDTLITEGFLCLSARLGASKLEYVYVTGGTSNYLTDGIRQVTYTLTARGLPATNKANPPSAGYVRNYRSHLADAMCVFNETSLVRNAADIFSAATTEESVTAGEALDATSGALGVALHTDNKYYKYSATYQNLQGVIEQGNSVLADASFTLKNLRGSSANHTGLTAGANYFVEEGGALTTTSSDTTSFLGKARSTTVIDHALQFNAEASSDAEITTGTDTTPKLQSAAQIKLGAQTHGSQKRLTIQPRTVAMEDGNISTINIANNTTAYYALYSFPSGIDVNKVSTELSSASTPSSYDLVVYSEDGQSQILSLTSGTPSASSVETTTLGTETTIPSGNYIIGYVANDTVNQNMRAGVVSPYIRGGVTGEPVLCYTETVTAGTLPATTDPTAGTETGSAIIYRFDN